MSSRRKTRGVSHANLSPTRSSSASVSSNPVQHLQVSVASKTRAKSNINNSNNSRLKVMKRNSYHSSANQGVIIDEEEEEDSGEEVMVPSMAHTNHQGNSRGRSSNSI